jgi:hypothetical protein
MPSVKRVYPFIKPLSIAEFSSYPLPIKGISYKILTNNVTGRFQLCAGYAVAA